MSLPVMQWDSLPPLSQIARKDRNDYKQMKSLYWKILRNISGECINTFLSQELMTIEPLRSMVSAIIAAVNNNKIPSNATDLLSFLSPHFNYNELVSIGYKRSIDMHWRSKPNNNKNIRKKAE